MAYDGAALSEREMRRLLRDHARTFALTLGFLPGALRRPLEVAYLLARASDTVADGGTLPREKKLDALEKLNELFVQGSLRDWNPPREGMAPAERELMEAVPRLAALLEGISEREILITLWQTILQGQLFDLRHEENKPLTLEELHHYCGLVAGSVGCAWTRLLVLHFPESLLAPQEEMIEWGRDYGKGLQLLNILRDRATDRALGRIYVREEEVSNMMDLAVLWLGQGGQYCAALRPGRIRYATELPFRFAIRTLRIMKFKPGEQGIKIGRRAVASTLLEAIPSLWLPSRPNPAS